ncbi:hypothetical protein F353_gp45 [Vibrio phage CP-T1]|uniref:hypothetical protein n=1 Tax=Vibrio phage CP-T1 TaxID=10689 RepID=UPI0002536CE6|nr:hypothetical protein F353_gp45 [Vibrio phage CP-T1]AFC22427.1 hypothetical protein CP-T1_0045 [Vibrio phage CP-T1]AIA08719.1 hypothetical protein SBVc24_0030 [Vibrio phage 24]
MDLLIDWLGDCPNCGKNDPLQVTTTKGSATLLYVGDEVTCTYCQHGGEIEVCDDCTYVNWGDLPEPDDGHDSAM